MKQFIQFISHLGKYSKQKTTEMRTGHVGIVNITQVNRKKLSTVVHGLQIVGGLQVSKKPVTLKADMQCF